MDMYRQERLNEQRHLSFPRSRSTVRHLMFGAEALQVALTQSSSEVDAQSEQARLAAT